MFPGRCHFTLILTACLSAAMPASAGPGYLATVGPVPLRFFPPARPFELTSTPRTAGVEPAPVRPENRSPVPPNTVNPPTVPPPAPPAVINEVSTPAPPLTPDDVVSPQMLLKYFNRSTNGPPAEIIAPINILTPRPSEPPSSKAAYSN